MKKNANKSLRRVALERLFNALTEFSRIKAEDDYPGGWHTLHNDKDLMVVRMFETVESILRGLVAEPLQMPHFGSAFDSALREFLEYRVALLYESWHIRKDLKDEEIDENVLKMRPEDCSAKELEKYRDPKARFDFVSVLCATFTNYRRTLTNFAYTAQTAAILAKNLNAPDAARHFLRLKSILSAKAKTTVMAFEPSEIDDIVEWYEHGREELLLALDYARLGDWKTRRDEVRELLKGVEPEASK